MKLPRLPFSDLYFGLNIKNIVVMVTIISILVASIGKMIIDIESLILLQYNAPIVFSEKMSYEYDHCRKINFKAGQYIKKIDYIICR